MCLHLCNMKIDFVALDVETANHDAGSICQIGLAAFTEGGVCREWESLVNPEADFNPYFTEGIHGLDATAVAEAPTLPQMAGTLLEWLKGQVVVCHTLFDQRALKLAFARYGQPEPDCRWLDSCMVARRAWAGESPEGYNLAAICAVIGYKFQHHDALEDAKAAGAIILAAERKTSLRPQDWLRESPA